MPVGGSLLDGSPYITLPAARFYLPDALMGPSLPLPLQGAACGKGIEHCLVLPSDLGQSLYGHISVINAVIHTTVSNM